MDNLESCADSMKSLRMTDHQIALINQFVIEHGYGIDPGFIAEIDHHVPAEYHIPVFNQHQGVGPRQITELKLDHPLDIGFDLKG